MGLHHHNLEPGGAWRRVHILSQPLAKSKKRYMLRRQNGRKEMAKGGATLQPSRSISNNMTHRQGSRVTRKRPPDPASQRKPVSEAAGLSGDRAGKGENDGRFNRHPYAR